MHLHQFRVFTKNMENGVDVRFRTVTLDVHKSSCVPKTSSSNSTVRTIVRECSRKHFCQNLGFVCMPWFWIPKSPNHNVPPGFSALNISVRTRWHWCADLNNCMTPLDIT